MGMWVSTSQELFQGLNELTTPTALCGDGYQRQLAWQEVSWPASLPEGAPSF